MKFICEVAPNDVVYPLSTNIHSMYKDDVNCTGSGHALRHIINIPGVPLSVVQTTIMNNDRHPYTRNYYEVPLAGNYLREQIDNYIKLAWKDNGNWRDIPVNPGNIKYEFFELTEAEEQILADDGQSNQTRANIIKARVRNVITHNPNNQTIITLAV